MRRKHKCTAYDQFNRWIYLKDINLSHNCTTRTNSDDYLILWGQYPSRQLFYSVNYCDYDTRIADVNH